MKEIFITKEELKNLVGLFGEDLLKMHRQGLSGRLFLVEELKQTLSVRLAKKEKPLFSTEFMEQVLPHFEGRKAIVLIEWVRRVRSLLNNPEERIKITILDVKKENLQNFEFPKDAEKGLIHCEIDLTGMTIDDLKNLLAKIQDRSIHHIKFFGKSSLTQEQLMDFLEQLFNVELIDVDLEQADKNIQARADQIIYRNQLMRQLGVRSRVGYWKELMEKWATTRPWRHDASPNSVFYLKPFWSQGQDCYHAYLKELYGLSRESKESPSRYYSSDRDSWGRNYELYSTWNACVSGMGSLFFDKILEDLDYLLRTGTCQHDVHFIINDQLTEEQFSKLARFIEEHRGELPFSKLSISVNKAFIQTPVFKALLQALKGSSIRGLELGFPWASDELKDAETDLCQYVAPFADYPIVIDDDLRLGSGMFSLYSFRKFEEAILENTRQKNIKKLRQGALASIQTEEKMETKEPLAAAEKKPELFSKKIKLKELMQRKGKPIDDYASYIKLEVQHIEVEQQRMEALQEVKEMAAMIEEAQQQQAQTYQRYEGELISYGEFQARPYYGIALCVPHVDLDPNPPDDDHRRMGITHQLYRTVRNELFANLPHGIKYLSHEAAVEISKNFPAFATFNMSNLPQHFLVKKTDKGELVLDYDPYTLEVKSNVFTPKASAYYETSDTIYDHRVYEGRFAIKQKEIAAWVGNPQLFDEMFIVKPNPKHANLWDYHEQKKPEFKPKRLINLWIRFGDEGIQFFFNKLSQIDQVHEKFSSFLFKHYLAYFIHWDHFLDNDHLFRSLDQMSRYDETKLACLQKFLEKTGYSKHDLKDTLAAFEVFWGKLKQLCEQHQVDIRKINHHWSTPVGGNPVIYMERLLTILENARNLNEQLDCLEGVVLDNYGAYYASKYEGFKVVSAKMQFKYDTDVQNKVPFDPRAGFHRVDLEKLRAFASPVHLYHRGNLCNAWLVVDAGDEITLAELEKLKEEKKAIPYEDKQFIGRRKLYCVDPANKVRKMVDNCLEVVSEQDYYALAYRFIGQQTSGIQFKDFSKGVQEYLRAGVIGGCSHTVFFALFFVAHERYNKTVSMKELMSSLEAISATDNLLSAIQEELMDLYRLGIKLDAKEGILIFNIIAFMNSNEFQSFHKNKNEYVKKIFEYLKKNKYGALKYFSWVSGQEKKSDQVIRISRANYIYAFDTAHYLSEDKSVAAAYKEDLLLFSGLISVDPNQAFCFENKHENAEKTSHDIEQLKQYLVMAATAPQPNNLDYAFRLIVQSKKSFTYEKILSAFKEITALVPLPDRPVDAEAVHAILAKHQFVINPNEISLPSVFARDDNDLKSIMMELIGVLSQSVDDIDLQSRLSGFTVKQLQEELGRVWKQSSGMVSLALKASIHFLLRDLRNCIIDREFASSGNRPFVALMREKVKCIQDFNHYDTFEKIDRIAAQASTLMSILNNIIKRENFSSKEERLNDLFRKADFGKFDYEMAYMLLSLVDNMDSMPQYDYFGILSHLFYAKNCIQDKEKFMRLIKHIQTLNRFNFSSYNIKILINLYDHIGVKDDQYDLLMSEIVSIAEKNKEDELLKCLINHLSLGLENIIPIFIAARNSSESDRDIVAKLLDGLARGERGVLKSFLEEMAKGSPEENQKILEMIAKSYQSDSDKHIDGQKLNVNELVKLLRGFGDENLGKLYVYFQATTASMHCLYDALKTRDLAQSFNDFLMKFERAPFGERIIAEQFDISQVERVVNQCKDLQNQSRYTYQYRKQLMESVLFVNAAGSELPIYYNKPAKELSNQEIHALFQDLKLKMRDKTDSHQRFQYGLLALGLMREAMYRSTGKFPYTTQMVALIDCMMHEGDVIAAIDTGQGKSLIDIMKASLLWLVSDRVDITTSSLMDAQRDLTIFGPFFDLLGINHGRKPVTASSAIGDFQLDGINYSTFPQLSLFFDKARGEGVMVGDQTDVISLVPNESDHSILDDRIIYRFAVSAGVGVGFGREWVYDAINEFIDLDWFRQNNTSEQQDIDALKAHLIAAAKTRNVPSAFIKQFSDIQLLTWVESALLVEYKVRENFDYVLPEQREHKLLNGAVCSTRVAKILMKDFRVSPEGTTFGNGMQQLLYARLNKRFGENQFLIEPESKTIISTNNKNLLDYYRAHHGFIWGSSGTVGSDPEIEEQYKQYGFAFSKIEPHQPNIVEFSKPHILENEQQQFSEVSRQIQANAEKRGKGNEPVVVFCKDIETARRFYDHFKRMHDDCQLYTGLEQEEQVIAEAAIPRMVTITTSALGRNTDIFYDKEVGMHVYQTFIDTVRGTDQKSGRTGRLGSPGKVHTILNQQDFPGKTVEQIKQELSEKSVVERRYNEELYNLLGFFLFQIDSIDPDHFISGRKQEFIKKKWADFSDNLEAMYRAAKLNGTYDKGVFNAEALRLFNQLLDGSVTEKVPRVTEAMVADFYQQHPGVDRYKVYLDDVRIADCVPPEMIAYQFLGVENKEASVDKQAVKQNLQKIFALAQQGGISESNKEYLDYLSKNAPSLQMIREAHQEFLSEFLQEAVDRQKKSSFIKRWFGAQKHLNKIANNRNYLLMFNALVHLQKDALVSADQLKPFMLALLDEYLQKSWFINSDRRNSVKKLKQQMTDASSVEALVAVLAASKKEMIGSDIAANKRFWRILRPLNVRGSRLQETLDHALAFTFALTTERVDVPDEKSISFLSNVVPGLMGELKKVVKVKDQSLLKDGDAIRTLDDFRAWVGSLRYSDKSSAAVLVKSIDKALRSDTLYRKKVGMIGRAAFFKRKAIHGPEAELPVIKKHTVK